MRKARKNSVSRVLCALLIAAFMLSGLNMTAASQNEMMDYLGTMTEHSITESDGTVTDVLQNTAFADQNTGANKDIDSNISTTIYTDNLIAEENRKEIQNDVVDN